ncbi:MAG TPA: cytochrome c3 family protein [Bacteroidales bacterium]
MIKHFHAKFKYLLSLILLSFFISQAPSNSPQATNISKLKSTDTTKIQPEDTSGIHAKDTSNLKPIETSKQPESDSLIFKRTTFSAEDLIRGERLFFGLVYLDNKSVSCVSCHNVQVSDTLNWNPDALEISRKYLDKSAYNLSKVLLKPIGAKMKLVHKEFQLTPEDIVLIKAYMNKFVVIGLKPEKPVITYLLLLIIASLLFLLSTVDIIIKRIFINQKINWAILTLTGIFITWILAVNAIAFGRSKGYAPAQPIKFSHAVHAGQNKTDCNYCHYTARISKTAGIPSGSICYNCHFLVRNGTRSGATEIAKILAHLDEKKPVEWVRIYKLPDFVFFSHEQHVSAGQITCDACHGNVKEMDRLYQVPDLSMGWCIDCHKTRKVNISNGYYKTYYPTFYDSLKAGKVDSIRVVGIGGRDCGKCHY